MILEHRLDFETGSTPVLVVLDNNNTTVFQTVVDSRGTTMKQERVRLSVTLILLSVLDMRTVLRKIMLMSWYGSYHAFFILYSVIVSLILCPYCSGTRRLCCQLGAPYSQMSYSGSRRHDTPKPSAGKGSAASTSYAGWIETQIQR